MGLIFLTGIPYVDPPFSGNTLALITSGLDKRFLLLCVHREMSHGVMLTLTPRWLRRPAQRQRHDGSPSNALSCCISHTRRYALSPRLKAR